MGAKGEVRLYITSVLDRGEWLGSRPGQFIAVGRSPSIHRSRGWLGPKLRLDG